MNILTLKTAWLWSLANFRTWLKLKDWNFHSRPNLKLGLVALHTCPVSVFTILYGLVLKATLLKVTNKLLISFLEKNSIDRTRFHNSVAYFRTNYYFWTWRPMVDEMPPPLFKIWLCIFLMNHLHNCFVLCHPVGFH